MSPKQIAAKSQVDIPQIVLKPRQYRRQIVKQSSLHCDEICDGIAKSMPQNCNQVVKESWQIIAISPDVATASPSMRHQLVGVPSFAGAALSNAETFSKNTPQVSIPFYGETRA